MTSKPITEALSEDYAALRAENTQLREALSALLHEVHGTHNPRDKTCKYLWVYKVLESRDLEAAG